MKCHATDAKRGKTYGLFLAPLRLQHENCLLLLPLLNRSSLNVHSETDKAPELSGLKYVGTILHLIINGKKSHS